MKAADGEFHWVPRLHQLFDTALPNGGYAHSQGLEGLVENKELRDEADVAAFLRAEFADALIHSDLPLFRFAYAAVRDDELDTLVTWDRLARALRPTRELRQAATAVGQQTYLLFERITRNSPREHRHLLRVGEFLESSQAPVVLAAIAAIVPIPLAAALPAYAQMQLSAMVAPCIKLLRFGPAQTQALLFAIGAEIPAWVERSLAVCPESIGTTSPRWDLASASHEHAERRLFIS